MDPSKGLVWAFSMLGVDVLEVLVLSEIIFWDSQRNPALAGNFALRIYFYVVIACMVIQIIGIFFVTRGWYKFGGALQIASSVIHVPKIEGLIGVVGGLKAWRYGEPTE